MAEAAFERLKEALADRYTIERELGSGGMATVYLAHDLKHERKIAVKVFRLELAAALGTERFFREIKITANLSHPHILPLLDSGEADGFLYYVMPVIEGETLRDRLSREKQLSVDDALKITSQVASALSYAHSHDIVHRDIKPENIMFQAGEVVAADFGIALAVDSAGGTRLTETGFSLGTPAYMSPEQVSGEQEIDGRSDVYSLACVLYEMLAGDPPFVASNPRAVLAKHMTDPVPPITTVRLSVPSPVAAALTRALGKAPADRFESATAFIEALFATEEVTEEETNSIVVLPFENLSPDPEQEYFSDGLTEEVISDLSKVNALQVISRSSAMTFKGSNKKTPDIASELNVRYVLEGSVRKAGNSLRITALLIDAERDVHMWAEKYTGTADDVFEMQENVSRAIVDALRVRLTPEEEQSIAERSFDSVRAYESYFRARRDVLSTSPESLQRATRELENALEILGPNPHLYTGLAFVHWQYVNVGLLQDEGIDRIDEYLGKAFALDPDFSEAHTIRAWADASFHGRQADAVRSCKRALARSPNEPLALSGLAMVYFVSGQTTAADAVVKRLSVVDPVSWLTHWCEGAMHFYAGRYAHAVELWRRSYEMEPEHPGGQAYYAFALVCNGDSASALRILEASVDVNPDHGLATLVRILMYALRGEAEVMVSALTPELSKTVSRDPYFAHALAATHAFVGMQDDALQWLEQAVSRGFINYPMLAEHDPMLESVRGEERFERLMVRVKKEWEEFEV